MLQTETQIGWQDYLSIVLRRRWFFAIPCVTVIFIALITGLSMEKIYRAETVLMVQDQNVVNPLIQGLAVSTPVSERLRTLREELLSWSSLSRLVTELSLDKNAKSAPAFEGLIRRLQRDISVRMRGNNLITIGYEDRNPKLAQSLVNAITKIYVERNVESQSAETETAIDVIETEMLVYKNKLEEAEHALREFKELYVLQMPVATELNEQIIDLEVQLARLLVENTEAHPTVLQVRQHIQDLKQKRNDEIRRVIAGALAQGHDPKIYQDLAHALEQPVANPEAGDPTLRVARKAYVAWVDRLESNIVTSESSPAPQVQVVAVGSGENSKSMDLVGASSSTSVSLAPREEQELARLTRDYQVYSATYREMQERLERAKMTQRLGKLDEGTKFKVLEPARLPLKPIKPNMAKIFVFGLLLGAFLGAAVAFVAEYLDQSFQSAEDLQAALAIPVIGTISKIITEGDIAQRRTQRKNWFSYPTHWQRLKTYVLKPVWSRVDRVLVRWRL